MVRPPLLPGLPTRRCGHWRRHPPNVQLMSIARIPTSPKSNASFLTSYCSWGSLPEEYEPDRVLRAAREKKGH